MRRMFTLKRVLSSSALIGLLLLALVAQEFRLFERAWFNVQQWRHAAEWQENSIWLSDYRVEIEAQPIVGLEDDISALTYDPRGQRLFVAKERDPLQIFEIHGFPQRDPDQPFAVHVLDDQKRDAGLFVRDLSSLQYDQGTGHLLALSDESRLVLELNVDGRPISSLSLLGGQQGLRKSVPQAEGVAMDHDGGLYLISEPNLFYVFKKKAGV